METNCCYRVYIWCSCDGIERERYFRTSAKAHDFKEEMEKKLLIRGDTHRHVGLDEIEFSD